MSSIVSVGRDERALIAVSIPFSSITRPTQSKRHRQGRVGTWISGGNSVGEGPGKMISARGKCHPPICSARLLVQALTKQKIPIVPSSGTRLGSPVCSPPAAASPGSSLPLLPPPPPPPPPDDPH